MRSERRWFICCCVVDVWLKVFAALTYFYSVVILGLSVPVLLELSRQIHTFRNSQSTRDFVTLLGLDPIMAKTRLTSVYYYSIAIVVVELFLAFGIASFVLFGTIKKNIIALWTALVLLAVDMVSDVFIVGLVIAGSTAQTYRGAAIGWTVIHFFIGGFIVYVTYRRIREAKEERENPEEGTAVFTS